MTNVALVVLDTLRKDAFDRHFDWLPGRRFDRAFATANWTVPVHASLFTGRYPSEVGVHAKRMHFDTQEPSLAERLREAGYTTRAFSANTNVTGHFGFDRGFDEFSTPDQFDHLSDDRLFDWRAFNQTTTATGVRKYLRGLFECVQSDAQTIPSLVSGVKVVTGGNGVEYGGCRELRSELGSMDIGSDEFLFCNLMETHEPYRAPSAYRRVDVPPLTESVGDIQFGSVTVAHVRRAYDDCARYLADAYRSVFDVLAGEFDVVITLSDHGEMLGERGALGHEHGLHRPLVHVPLVISGDGLEGTVQETVSLLDVHETVLDLAGETSEARGRSLVGTVEGRDCLTEYNGLTTWSERKLVENGKEELVPTYDEPRHGFAADPDGYGYETIDGFVETGSGGPRHPESRLSELIADLAVRDVDPDQTVPDEVADRLRDLGYA